MSVEGDLLDGVAQLLATASVCTYSTSGVYTSSQTGLYFSLMPPGSDGKPAGPERCVVLTTYPLSDEPDTNGSLVGLQVRTRGTTDPRDVLALDELVFNQLHGLTHRQFGTCHVVQMLRRSSVPMGQDANRRWERSSNYHVDVNTPDGLYRGN